MTKSSIRKKDSWLLVALVLVVCGGATRVMAQGEAAPEVDATAAPDSETVGPDSETAAPDSETAAPDSETVGPDSETVGPDAETTGPDAGDEADTAQDPEAVGGPSAETVVPDTKVAEREVNPADDERVDVEELSVEALLLGGWDVRGGQAGGYAKRLAELGIDVSVHAYMSLEFKPQGSDQVPTFDLHHATLMLRASIYDRVFPEIALEWEHIGKDFYMPHLFYDIFVEDWLVIRAGYFEVPIGAFNEYLYPDFLRTSAIQPLFSRNVIPGLWSEVGVQIRGQVSPSPSLEFNYALYIVNGLEQADADPDDGVIDEGGDIRSMRFHDRDKFDPGKAVGGRLGAALRAGFDFGVSGYTGAYTVDGNRRLSYVDVDASYSGDQITLRLEAVMAFQEVTGSTLLKYGGYGLISYRATDYLEPYVQVETRSLDGDRTHRFLGGMAVYPFSDFATQSTLRLKLEGGRELDSSGSAITIWLAQLTMGF